MSARFYRDDLLLKNELTVRLQTGSDIIATDFIQTPLDISIAHDWATSGGIMQSFREGIVSGKDTIQTMARQGVDVAGAISQTFGGADANQLVGSNGADQLNAKNMTASSYFKRFNGTNISIPLNIQFRFLTDESDYDIVSEVSTLMDYLIGDFQEASGKTNKQMAPNNYGLPVDRDFNTEIQGAFTLHYGTYGSIRNLLVSNARISCPQDFCTNGKFQRINVDISLIPGLMFTKEDVKSILGIKG